jgi:hypothetical protein
VLPAADLPDLVLEIAAKTGFIDAFTNDQEPGAKLDGLATSLCAALRDRSAYRQLNATPAVAA